MNKCKLLFGFLLAYICAFEVFAYEVTTHRVLTREAAVRSLLNTSSGAQLLSDLGLNGWNAEDYVGSTGEKATDILGIMAFGADFEDGDDQHPKRVYNHFFDTQYDNFAGRGLSFTPLVQGLKSPDWALEEAAKVTAPAGDTQEFSYRNAQEYFYASLAEPTPAGRLAKASKMFQSLGQVVHHIEDMAQPQHVRNDQHVHDVSFNGEVYLRTTEWSFYERYTASDIDARIPDILAANPYPLPSFPTARQFWHTPGANTARFVGMAEFTAQNYVSYGTQYRGGRVNGEEVFANHADFPLPNGSNRDGSPKRMMPQDVTVRFTDGVPRTGRFEFLMGNVFDELTGQTKYDQRLAAASLLTPHFDAKGLTSRRFLTENTEVYKDAYDVLLPRAVAFSAGLINHFFRGRLNFRKNSQVTNGWLVGNLGVQDMSGPMDFIVGRVHDELNPDTFQKIQRLASPSIPNQPAVYRRSCPGRHVENSAVYEDAYKILFPHAVAFSAGLINRFLNEYPISFPEPPDFRSI